MSDTPRTDALQDHTSKLGLNSIERLHDFRDFARQLERELNEAKKDKARLNWIFKNCIIKEFDLGWIHDSREEIDEAMGAA